MKSFIRKSIECARLLVYPDDNVFNMKYILHRRKESIINNVGFSKTQWMFNSEIPLRIVSAYIKATKEQVDIGDSIWGSITRGDNTLNSVLLDNNINALEKIYNDPFNSNIYCGYDAVLAKQIKNSKNRQKRLASMVYDGLYRLAEAMGVARMDNPERYYKEPIKLDTEILLQRIDEELEWKVEFPNPYPNEYGLETKRGVASYRAVQALYQAWRVRELLGSIMYPRVIEIGAGLGRTAYYAYKLGVKDYTIIDLALVNVSQAHFLGSVLGDENIKVYGERETGLGVKILPTQSFYKLEGMYDLILNADSMTEMDKGVALQYWNTIRRKTNIFVSINHENNLFTVKELTGNFAKVNEYTRYEYWMRKGYVEEVVRF
jgi:SAM-dependent methyltransferase